MTLAYDAAQTAKAQSSGDDASLVLKQASCLRDVVACDAAIAGRVNKILTHSLVDGPGNRAVVFLQGCNLHCLFCHNPQTLNVCNACGVCVDECPQSALTLAHGQVHWDAQRCAECDTCTEVCPNFSTPRTRYMTPAQVWCEIEPLSPFLSGVTVSGGEPTEQPEFLIALLTLVKQLSNLSTFVETNGCASVQDLQRLLPVLDGAMIDLKAMDAAVHRRLTGQDNAAVKTAIRFLAFHSKVHSVRVTVVPGYNDSLENAAATARFIADLSPNIRLRFLRFRAHGTRGSAQSWESPPDTLMDELVDAARAEGLRYVSRSI